MITIAITFGQNENDYNYNHLIIAGTLFEFKCHKHITATD